MINIYVGNLSFNCGESELQEVFAEFGEVQEVQIITDRTTGRSRGFGFVRMLDNNAGLAAIAAVNGRELAGRALVVNEAKAREESGRPRGGSRR